MLSLAIRAGVLLLASLVAWLAVRSGRSFVEQRRRQAFSALPLATVGAQVGASEVRILAFSSEDCAQCHRLQAPALKRVEAMRGERVSVEEIDAPASPELTRRYQVLTVPTTVVLDARGRVQAVNYGFANTQRLLEQVDAVLMERAS